jgi:hypothetical protein
MLIAAQHIHQMNVELDPGATTYPYLGVAGTNSRMIYKPLAAALEIRVGKLAAIGHAKVGARHCDR